MLRAAGSIRAFSSALLTLFAAMPLFPDEARATGCPGGSQTLACAAYWSADGGLCVGFNSPQTSGSLNIGFFWEPDDVDASGGTIIRLGPNSTITLKFGAPPPGKIAYKVTLYDETGAVLYCLHAPFPPASFTENALRNGALRGKFKFYEPPSMTPYAVLGVKGAARFDGESRNRTLSGTLLERPVTGTSWLLYPDACTDLQNGTWSPRTSRVADSLDSYATGATGPYQRVDLSLNGTLWHVVDSSAPADQRPPILSGNRSLWCGKYDPNWIGKVGYPNASSGYQILYLDTGAHGANYTLSLVYKFSCEIGYDHIYLIGGGADDPDPIGNSRAILDQAIMTGSSGSSELLASWTGSVRGSTPGATAINAIGGPVEIVGDGAAQPDAIAATIQIAAAHRALYLILQSDGERSPEDGLWPYGQGAVVDFISTNDNGVVYDEQVAAGGIDAYGGSVIVGSPTAPTVAARVTWGMGELWQVVDGSNASTPDWCSLQKSSAFDRMFFGVDAISKKTIPGQSNAIVTCPIPVPAGTAMLTAMWDEFINLPQGSGYVRRVEYSYFKDGVWSDWINVFGGGGAGIGGSQAWHTAGAELIEAEQADLVQIRFDLACVPAMAADGVSCGLVDYGILYDNLRLEAVTGVSVPVVGAFPGSLAQSTFVDGTMTGTNCTIIPCWPGVRGSDVPSNPSEPAKAIHDNFNSPLGDSITVAIASALRRNGMGINWKRGFDKSVDGGLTIAHTNASYNSAYDTPRMIYQLYDPATTTWSPLDSTELDADAVSISGQDTVVIGTTFRVDWPPRDKAGLNLPGGFTINGVAAYSNLAFLPRGCRMKYTFKGVDINGGLAYLPFPIEIEELEPIIPGHPFLPVGFNVLPGRYPAGSGGSLLAGKTSTPILNLDGAYEAWSDGYDPVSEELRGMGVRADRYRFLQGFGAGGNIGGHELTEGPDYQHARLQSNYFPNMTEYGIKDSLAQWYRIIIQSSHAKTLTVEDEQDALLLEEWWATDTGSNGGDRCIFASGDNYFRNLVSPPAGESSARRMSYAQNVFGVAYATDAWNGSASIPYPTIDDGFANQLSGPSLVTGYIYPVDNGCPRPNRFDALTPMGSSSARAVALYPTYAGVNDVAGVARNGERDAISDGDRNKALGYGFSIQYVRKMGIPTSASNYPRSGVEERMRVLYKFLTSCRGGYSGASDCWPCPTDANMPGNWAILAGFNIGTYGPLYPIQDPAMATGVSEELVPEVPTYSNTLTQNRPNPFNPRTVIRYSLGSNGPVRVQIFAVSGRLVRTLVDVPQKAGWHEAPWDGRTDDGGTSASGMYFYRIVYPDGSNSARKMVILR